MNILDSRRICRIEGCECIGRWSKRVKDKIYRSSLCDKHHRKEYHMETARLKAKERFKLKGLNEKCMLCGWKGPCDVHRKDPIGTYNMENMISTCPNCHRLIHRGLLTIDGYTTSITATSYH